jgi:hypothetical protein
MLKAGVLTCDSNGVDSKLDGLAYQNLQHPQESIGNLSSKYLDPQRADCLQKIA